MRDGGHEIVRRWERQQRSVAASEIPNLVVCQGPLPRGESTGRHEAPAVPGDRSEEHTSELQSRFGISYAVFCLKKKTNRNNPQRAHLPPRGGGRGPQL